MSKASKRFPVLTSDYFALMKQLSEGYPTLREKLDALFFTDQPLPDMQVVIVPYCPRQDNVFSESEELKNRPFKEPTFSSRMFSGPITIKVIYPGSHRKYKGRVRGWQDWCAIEPVESNLAAWVVERKYLETNQVLDLNVIPHIRVIHDKAGREFLSDFR